ncbi:peptidyl-prolyl cis-trans isomerase C [Polaromonas sp. OV174]|uniref:peptidylprolyl isomerase n=1 Tax=Polaromonas sp. OV174 TaxID=1855300 RepID=UPI0008E9D287|nr:peptidylprolyl isomerase [Polaromonas sp. OV174]SFC20345.1 peptidyl-prolyl cis-trans isomerase C [Polaromonas sp. OV174]
MNAQTSTVTGCGSSACQCASTSAQMAAPTACINGIALHAPGQRPETEALRELAYSELLRQHAVMKGLLPRHTGLTAPALGEAERKVIEAMVDDEVPTLQPGEDEGQRYYEAHKQQFVVGQALHVRHILFAVTPGVNVHALTVHAEKALLELSRKDVPPDRFAQLAGELSNCPSSAQGGDLGWIGPDDCAPELASELFHQKHSQWGMGVHPRLMHTRFGFHIIEVLSRRAGKQPAYAEVRERIAALLTMQSRARALHQYMSLLVGEALVEGIELEGADSPLVQ